MNLLNTELQYEYHAKDIGRRFKVFADQAVKEIKQQVGEEPDISVFIEKEEKSKNLHQVAISITGNRDDVFVKKEGKNLVGLIKKVKKLALNKARESHNKRLDRARININRALKVS